MIHAMKPGAENANRSERTTTRKYRRVFQNNRLYPVPFGNALALLVPDRSRVALLDLFENRVTFQSICHWRKGRHQAPAWAHDIVARELEQIALVASSAARISKEKAGTMADSSSSLGLVG